MMASMKAEVAEPVEQCSRCRFWQVERKEDEDESGYQSFGWCRRNPPIVLDHMARMTIPPLGNRSDNYDPEDVATVVNVYNARIFPATYGAEWCGEFRAGSKQDL